MRTTILGALFVLVFASSAGAADRPQASLEDLTLLTESGISDQTILVFLDTREIGFLLDAETIARLRQQGVSEEVIRHLLERAEVRDDRDEVVYVAPDPYPRRYYYPYHYGYGVGSYLGAAILGHWTHGHHRVGHHLGGGHHLGLSFGRSSSYGVHYTGGGHLVGGHGARSHLGSHGSSRHSARHRGYGHGGRSHGRGGHGGGHGGGGHGRGH